LVGPRTGMYLPTNSVRALATLRLEAALQDRRLRDSASGVPRVRVVEYIAWYNAARLHERRGDIPPAEFEQRHAQREAITLAGAAM
jgi:hypothetical protein